MLNVPLDINSELFKLSNYYMEDPINSKEGTHVSEATPEDIEFETVPPPI